MQRSDIVEIFPEATKEQLDALLNINGADINKAKGDMAELNRQLKEAQEALAASAGNDQSEELKKAQEALATVNSELATLKAANELRQIREKVAAEKKIPANLLNGEDEAACIAQADAILAFAKPGSYPAVKDGGEPANPTHNSPRDQFASWANDNS